MQTITDGTVKWAVRDKRLSAMVDLFYPVGSVYISGKDVSKDDIPFMAYGTWEEITNGLVLQTVISGKSVGDTVDAGLPNIEGYFKSFHLLNKAEDIGGAFYNPNTERGLFGSNNNGDTDYRKNISFDASKSNTIYGSSDTVQPPAYMVKAWVRTA